MTLKVNVGQDARAVWLMRTRAGVAALALVLAANGIAYGQSAPGDQPEAKLPDFARTLPANFGRPSAPETPAVAPAATVTIPPAATPGPAAPLPTAALTAAAPSANPAPDDIAKPNRVGAGNTASVKPVVKPSAPKPTRRPLGQASGCGSAGALGVSRVQAVDSTAGPRYGHQQFKDIDFLQDGEVVLTFDDGPLRPYTMPVLRALEAHCTKATFFVVGRMALSDPALVKDMAKRGHTIGSHTWSHMDLRKTNPARARGEMELGISAVSRALGRPAAPFFRFPYLSSPQSMLDYARSRRIASFSIEVDSNDYRTKDPSVVQHNVLSQLQESKKGIILFHDIQASTAGALRGLLDELKARGFKVVHMVPTAPVTTLPEYDAMADKEMSRKSAVASADPLASRSIVWPVQGGDGAQKTAGGAGPLGEEDEVLPWGVVAPRHSAAAPTPPVAKAKPKPAPVDDGDWLTKLFRF